MLTLEQTGMTTRAIQTLLELAYGHHGIILVTGPPKSGKTTTVGAIAKELRTAVAPPFPRDISVVDSIDSQETALKAIESALDGILVLCTLESAGTTAAAISQLVDLGIEPLPVATSIKAIMRQELLPVIHPKCKAGHTAAEEEIACIRGELDEMELDQSAEIVLFKGQGCPDCSGTGYLGQIGVFELMPISRAIRDLILEPGWTPAALRAKAMGEGMQTMAFDACLKACLGLITIEDARTLK